MVRRHNPLNPTHSGNARYMQCNLSKSYTCARGCINKCVYACVYIYIYMAPSICASNSLLLFIQVDTDTYIHM